MEMSAKKNPPNRPVVLQAKVRVSRAIKQARQLGLIPIIEAFVTIDKTSSVDDAARRLRSDRDQILMRGTGGEAKS